MGRPLFKTLEEYYIERDCGYITLCWIWRGTFGTNGYGKYESINAHVYIYKYHGFKIPEGLHLDHMCNIIACVNPTHMQPLTQAENNRKRKSNKLTIENIREIRKLLNSGENTTNIARKFSVTRDHIGDIRRGKTWFGIY